jgi:DNA repair protein RecN (Recombination protein N)
MLRELKVKNYAIIEEILVQLAPGLTVLTGETGAGKSIIVGALSFVLGERVSDDVVRKGADTCRVDALFDVATSTLRQHLTEYDDAPGPRTELRISREIARAGRSRCYVDGKPVSLAQLRRLGDLLVDFHGQHEHQLLLDAGSHVGFLDGFGRLCDLRDRLAEKIKTLAEIAKKAGDLESEIAYLKQQEDFIRFEIREIEQLELEEDEDGAIEREINLLQHAEKIIEAGSEALDAIYEADESALQLVSRALVSLGRIASYADEFEVLLENLDQAEVIIKEVASSLRDSLSRIDLDSSRLETLRERRAVIERLKRKYGETLKDVLDHLGRLKAGLDSREQIESDFKELSSAKVTLEGELAELAGELSAKRKAAAKRFEKLIEGELRSLGIEGGGFRVVLEPVEDGQGITGRDGRSLTVGVNGIDNVEFYVRTNRGEDLLPLRRIASGGEISRVMLGLKKILADVDEVGTMVFDEIDSGIGGSVADVVASKLREVADKRQAVCITHLAQIAALAELHLAVGKASASGRTTTVVERVSGDERVMELARMIGGRKPPKSARLHAEEILKKAVAR